MPDYKVWKGQVTMTKTITLAAGVEASVCRALGLDPGQVERIELIFDAQEVSRAVVSFYLTPQEAGVVGETLFAAATKKDGD